MNATDSENMWKIEFQIICKSFLDSTYHTTEERTKSLLCMDTGKSGKATFLKINGDPSLFPLLSDQEIIPKNVVCEATKKNPAILSDPTELPVQFQCNMVCTPGVITSIPCLLMVCCILFEPRREATNCYLSIILIKFCFKIAKFARKCYWSYDLWRVACGVPNFCSNQMGASIFSQKWSKEEKYDLGSEYCARNCGTTYCAGGTACCAARGTTFLGT